VKILVLHGPNLNLLGAREPATYGKLSLREINTLIRSRARMRGAAVVIHQSNSEGEIIDAIHRAGKKGSAGACDAIVINPGAYAHTSIAIRDAIEAVAIPVFEVHLSNIYAREEFRHRSVVAPVCRAHIVGLGHAGYLAAIDAAIDLG
jgi:3-dehydroquinate dehydratase-2